MLVLRALVRLIQDSCEKSLARVSLDVFATAMALPSSMPTTRVLKEQISGPRRGHARQSPTLAFFRHAMGQMSPPGEGEETMGRAGGQTTRPPDSQPLEFSSDRLDSNTERCPNHCIQYTIYGPLYAIAAAVIETHGSRTKTRYYRRGGRTSSTAEPD